MPHDRVLIFDTTLRDGEQSPGCSLNLDEKVRMARQLDALGVDVIEAGFPAASDGDFAAVAAVARAVRRPVIAALCRATAEDVDRAAASLDAAARPRLHTFVATSDVHLVHKLKRTREEALEMAVCAVERARRFADDVEFSAEDATRTDVGFLARVVAAVIDAGATVVNIPDTVGRALPRELAALLGALRERVPALSRVTLSVHGHDDLGLAVANSLAAVAAGARQVECTVNGIGERAGNAALEEVVMALRVRADLLPFETGVVSEEIARSSQLLSALTGSPVQPNKAIVGRNAFRHEAGIHQHGVLENRMTYEIMSPESVGVKTASLVLGKHSGRHALKRRFEELGYPLDGAKLDKAYRMFSKLSDQKKEVVDEDLLAIVHDGIVTIPEAFKLRLVQATAGTAAFATALVTLAGPDGERTETAKGDGPVNAACEAIAKLTGWRGEVVEYTVRSVSHGADAVGEAVLRVRFEGVELTGRAASTDVVDASARAYLNAVNRAVHARAAREAPVAVALAELAS